MPKRCSLSAWKRHGDYIKSDSQIKGSRICVSWRGTEGLTAATNATILRCEVLYATESSTGHSVLAADLMRCPSLYIIFKLIQIYSLDMLEFDESCLMCLPM